MNIDNKFLITATYLFVYKFNVQKISDLTNYDIEYVRQILKQFENSNDATPVNTNLYVMYDDI
jgi:hypothetical protein